MSDPTPDNPLTSPRGGPGPRRVRDALGRVPGISLANKSQVLFGLSSALILTVTLSIAWVRGSIAVREYEAESPVRLAAAWLDGRSAIPPQETASGVFTPRVVSGARPVDVTFVSLADLLDQGEADAVAAPSGGDASPASAVDDAAGAAGAPGPDVPDVPDVREAAEAAEAAAFVLAAASFFADDPGAEDYRRRFSTPTGPVDRTAIPLRAVDLAGIAGAGEIMLDAASDPPSDVAADEVTGPETAAPDEVLADPIIAMLVVDEAAGITVAGRLRTQIVLVSAGVLGFLLSIVAYHLTLTKLVLSPVRSLRRTAEGVQAGDLSIRSKIRTGDEFEQLAGTFNAMLDAIESSRAELERVNRQLDLKVDQLAEANVGLDESNRLKSEFVASVSHELRTPLNSIIGFAELLQEVARGEDNADPKRDRFLGNIVTSGRNLLEMINELLDMAKIEAGRMELSIEPTNVTDMIEGLVRIMGPQADGKAITLETEIDDRITLIETDPGKLQQILYNFTSNAVKFTPREGSVTLAAERVSRQGSAVFVRIAVTDTGPGIPADMQDVVFEKFRQIDAGHTREHAGTGLGLAICKSLAEMMGAEVDCSSRPGEGATFSVEVPVEWRPAAPASLMP